MTATRKRLLSPPAARLTPPRPKVQPAAPEGRPVGVVKVSIWNCSWRDGRPRFSPGPKLRTLVGQGHDLKHENGDWFSLEETTAWATAKKAEVEARRQAKAEGRRVVIPRARARGLTVSNLFQEWFASAPFNGGVNKGKRQEKPLSKNTVRDYRGKARAFEKFDPDVAASPPAAITDELAQSIYEAMWERLGLYMANGVVATCSACWSWAGGVGRAGLKRANNPWKAVNRTTPDPRVVVLEDFEIRSWIAACDLPDSDGIARPELGDAIMLGLMTGQRQGDRLALTDAGRDDKGRRKFRQNKTGAIVAIPETPQLAARMLAAAERRKQIEVIDPHVILDERRKRPFLADHYRHQVAERRRMAIEGVVDIEATAAARAAGRNDPEPIWKLPPCPSLSGKRDQDLRDTAVTWLARAGCNVMQIAAITGHSLASIHGVLKHYLALHPEMADAAIGALIAWMDENGVVV